jgi:WD40 repeat protein
METKELSLFLKRQTLRPEAQHGSEITRRFAMNRVGRMIAAAIQDRSVRLFDARQCEEMQRIQDEFLCTSIAFSPKGDIVATGSVGRVITLWDIRHGERIGVLDGHTYPVLSLAFSPDGSKLVSGSGDTTLIIWDVERQLKLKQLKGHSLYVVSCDWDPLQNRIVSSSVDSTIKEWDSETGALIADHDTHRTAVHTVRFSRDGKLLASGSSDNTIVIWDAEGPLKELYTLKGHEDEVRAVAFSHDDRFLASGSGDKVLYVWDLATKTIEGESSTNSEIDGLEWYPDELAFVSSDGTGAITRWEVTELAAVLRPFQELLSEIEADPTLSRKEELLEKFEATKAQYDPEVLRDKRLFYVMWQCKRALGLLKGTTRTV